MSESRITEGSWEFTIYGLPAGMIEEQRKLGIEPTRILSNDGAATIMGGPEDDRRPVARVECHAPFKRGQGHKSVCAERDANARLIAAAPDLLEACEAFAAFERHTPDCANCDEWGAGNCQEGHRLYSVACDSINEAIAKAKGESK